MSDTSEFPIVIDPAIQPALRAFFAAYCEHLDATSLRYDKETDDPEERLFSRVAQLRFNGSKDLIKIARRNLSRSITSPYGINNFALRALKNFIFQSIGVFDLKRETNLQMAYYRLHPYRYRKYADVPLFEAYLESIRLLVLMLSGPVDEHLALFRNVLVAEEVHFAARRDAQFSGKRDTNSALRSHVREIAFKQLDEAVKAFTDYTLSTFTDEEVAAREERLARYSERAQLELEGSRQD